ncbi:hypothetical protein F4808DRAFT_443676, partial [Astrocystis sublimbata]
MTSLSKYQVSCNIYYKVFFDTFEICGMNLSVVLFVADSEGFKSQLFGCDPGKRRDLLRGRSIKIDERPGCGNEGKY